VNSATLGTSPNATASTVGRRVSRLFVAGYRRLRGGDRTTRPAARCLLRHAV